jgi:hypothetical protein
LNLEHSRLQWFQRHIEKLWWAHSAYALLLGIDIMWVGARDFTYLRIAVFHVGAIWLISLFLTKLLAIRACHPSGHHASAWWRTSLTKISTSRCSYLSCRSIIRERHAFLRQFFIRVLVALKPKEGN